ncbi:MAG: hypothetical protein HPY75_10790 [Actinobacteria bacterium]|nr:hypothetical protein [Actinomycetota bacterium]
MAAYRVKIRDCDAVACGYRCQEACPHGVFLAVPRTRNRARHAAEPRYRVVPRFAAFCDGCGECVRVCAADAITVLAPGGAAVRVP